MVVQSSSSISLDRIIFSSSQFLTWDSTDETPQEPTTASSSSDPTTRRPWRSASMRRRRQLRSDCEWLHAWMNRAHRCRCVSGPVPSLPWRMCASTSPESWARWWWVRQQEEPRQPQRWVQTVPEAARNDCMNVPLPSDCRCSLEFFGSVYLFGLSGGSYFVG